MFFTDKGDRFVMQFKDQFVILSPNDVFTLNPKTNDLKLYTRDGECPSKFNRFCPQIVSKVGREHLLKHFYLDLVDGLSGLELDYFHAVRKASNPIQNFNRNDRLESTNAHNIRKYTELKADYYG